MLVTAAKPSISWLIQVERKKGEREEGKEENVCWMIISFLLRRAEPGGFLGSQLCPLLSVTDPSGLDGVSTCVQHMHTCMRVGSVCICVWVSEHKIMVLFEGVPSESGPSAVLGGQSVH